MVPGERCVARRHGARNGDLRFVDVDEMSKTHRRQLARINLLVIVLGDTSGI